jgi:peptide/nickel transport system substrate-binding protein
VPADSASRFEGVLAERFRLEPDGQGIDLWVRKGVRFHDGHPLTAYDVRMTLEMVMQSPQSAPRTQALLSDVLRVTMIGKDIVHLDLRRPTGPTHSILTALSEIDILPASQFPNGKLAYQPFNRRPVCTGPFRLIEWKRGSHLLLRRSPTYWGAPPATDELRLLIAPDGARGLAHLRQGEAELLLRVAPRYLADQVEPAVQRGRWQKLELDANQLVALVWNGRHPALGSASVRRALATSIDRLRLVREVRSGLGTPVSGPLLAADRVADPGASSPVAGAALSAAGALLDQAGMTRMSPGGPRQFQGRPLSVRALVPAGSTELAEASRRIGEALARAGVKWETEVVDLPTLVARMRRGSFEAALLAWSWSGSDSDLDLEPLLRFALPDQHPGLAELLGALHARPPAGSVLWEREQAVTLLYRTRQLSLLSPAIRPLPLPTTADALDLRRIYLDKGPDKEHAQSLLKELAKPGSR